MNRGRRRPRGPSLPRGSLVWTVAWRFLRGSRSRLLDGTARAALLATALGVTAMVIAMALMTGYREDLQTKLIRGNAAVVAYPLEGGAGRLDAARLDRLRRIPGVVQVGRVAYGQGSLASARRPDGLEVVLRGVEPEGGQLAATAAELALSPRGIPGVVMGSDLAARLAVRPGDALRLVVLGFAGGTPHFRFQSVELRRTFSTGFAEFDRSWVLLERSRVEALMGLSQGADLLELAVADPAAAPHIADAVARVLEPGYAVTDWQQLNRELFTALRVQKVVLFFLLGCIVGVSVFNVASTLVVMVRERMRDIGVLGALGLAPARLCLVFLTYGAILASIGTLMGVAVGGAASWALTTFRLIRFDSEVAAIYFISFVPFRVTGGDVAWIAGCTLLVTLVACFVPALLAGWLDPSAALRYE
jgi:lipoprotein-releasing system permease protein